MLVIRMTWENHCFIFRSEEEFNLFCETNADVLEGVEYNAEWVIL